MRRKSSYLAGDIDLAYKREQKMKKKIEAEKVRKAKEKEKKE